MQTRAKSNLEKIHSGEVTIAELKGITEAEMRAGVGAGLKLIERGEDEAAAEVLSGLALYDPYRRDVWEALEQLFRRQMQPEPAALFGRIARAMAA